MHKDTDKPGDDSVVSRPIIGDVIELAISDILTNGQGVGRYEGNVVFVFGPLPGERARVRIVELKPRYMVAESLELLEVSPDRVEPFCGVFGHCGGCQVQHLAYPAQLAWKRETVVQALRRIGGLEDVDVRPTVGMEKPRAYRNKMSLVVGHGKAFGTLGFYAMRSHELVAIDECPIVLPALQADLQRLNELVKTEPTKRAFVDVRHVVIRRARTRDQGVMALTSMKPAPEVGRQGAELARSLPGIVGITNSYAPTSENVVLGRKQQLVSGVPTIEETMGDARFRISVQSFFQVNGEMIEQIIACLKPHFTTPAHTLDLYCGAGAFAVIFAALGSTVFGLEENPYAIEEARANAEENGVAEKVKFAVGKVEQIAASNHGRAQFAKAERIFLDPPRKGTDDVTLQAMIASGARDIWYLSCNPATLARDAAVLVQGRFRIALVQPFDMFPQTGHIEVLTHFERTP